MLFLPLTNHSLLKNRTQIQFTKRTKLHYLQKEVYTKLCMIKDIACCAVGNSINDKITVYTLSEQYNKVQKFMMLDPL